jgi:predicted MFS family arabinose efflux permease
MAILGVTIGTVFSAAMILGPLFNSWFSASGIFWVSSLLGLLALIILKTWTPTPQKTILHPDVEIVPANLKNILCNSQLLRLNLGVLCLHAILTANFVVLPILLQSHAHLAEKQQWMIYLPSLILAFISMVPIIIWGEKKQNLHSANLFAIGLLAIAETVLYRFTYSAPIMAIGLWLFFTAFTALEATMPSAISKIAPAHSKGTAMGVYSSSQFLGIFLGGSGGGWLYSHFPLPNVLLACILLTIIWFLIMLCDRRE